MYLVLINEFESFVAYAETNVLYILYILIRNISFVLYINIYNLLSAEAKLHSGVL